MPRTFLITGVSSGLGRAFATAALEAGHTVVGTVRTPDHAAAFEQLAPGRAHARVLDVTDTDAIAPTVAAIEEEVGRIDVLVNNAGYGVEGTFEETSLDTFRRQFDVNVFGVVAVTQAVLPRMRERRAGHILFVSSMGGLRAFPGLAAYHGSKFAVEGIAATLAQEVAPLGIHVTAIEPGSFRTDWAGRSMHRVESTIADYDKIFAATRERRLAMSGHQLGNPAQAGRALLALVEAETPPTHLILGSDALRLVADARSAFDAETAAWSELSESTDYPDGEQIA
ncbi:oxidoreductase [Streptomyces jeddahensis]|uniref:3-oxoacyl-[acyl-carrier-protein] reductase FabG n=1 Tax=Streptomyces jeddahensis TaxID=1716141 RepID=A0A177HIH1_9ACTN|nr:oxidoreductase [Streptomyces jeddahensis]OAH10762.1 3-oxoacyl-[acyl-carrier-protein] reductase FabG [Streptomyces jeddahensis]